MPVGLLFVATVTAYAPDCKGCSGVMASGAPADAELLTVATSKAWPLGACVDVLGADGAWNQYEVTDRLGKRQRARKDSYQHLDVLVGSTEAAVQHGVQQLLAQRVDCVCPV